MISVGYSKKKSKCINTDIFQSLVFDENCIKDKNSKDLNTDILQLLLFDENCMKDNFSAVKSSLMIILFETWD